MARRLAAILAADVAGYSRLMSEDEAGTLAALQAHRAEAIEPSIARHGGRIVKLMGDGILSEFPSVVEAVACAADIQRDMTYRNQGIVENRRMVLRIGVHLGDVIAEGEDIYGDGVNVAARLEGLADAGGICISRQVFEHVDGKIQLSYRELGAQTLKNIPKPVEVYAVDLGDKAGEAFDPRSTKQEIRYCRAPDGVRLAYSTVGRGPPLVKPGNWMSHLEHDWDGILSHLYASLARNFTLLRYDARGNGLSDWDVETVSLDAWVSDLEAVVNAAGLDRFALFGISQGCAIAIDFAVRHPKRVSHLILYGGFARGRMKRAQTEADRQKVSAMATLIQTGWSEDNPAFRQLFTSLFIPDGTKEQTDKFTERQRDSTSAECAYRYFQTVNDFDVTDLLPKVTAPTLVMHVRGDQVQPFECGRELAAGIPGARFVALQGRNHAPLEQDAATARLLEEINLFVNG